jgi:hypothetical protein
LVLNAVGNGVVKLKDRDAEYMTIGLPTISLAMAYQFLTISFTSIHQNYLGNIVSILFDLSQLKQPLIILSLNYDYFSFIVK